VTAPTVAFELSTDFQVFPLEDGAGEPPDRDPVRGVLAAGYRAVGMVFAANLVGLVADRPAIGHFTVTIEPFEDVDPRTAALAIAQILSAERQVDRAVKLVRLPCGPAVATEEVRDAPGAPEPPPDRNPPPVQFGQSQVFVKPPRCAGLVVLTMATLMVRDLTWYTRELALVAQSLRFR